VSVSPVGVNASEELVLSTLGHELGHAIFDAPGWIVDASKGPGLFDEPPTQVLGRIGAGQNVVDEVSLVLQYAAICPSARRTLCPL
jgi:hypothetical protein